MPLFGVETEARRAALTEFVASKRCVRTSEVMLCALYWMDAERPHDPDPDDPAAPPERVARAVRAAEITALYPRHEGRRIHNAAALLRHHAEHLLAEALGGGFYRITPFGRVVVEAFPDRSRVAQLRGLRVSMPYGRA